MPLRKIIKTLGDFPSDEAATKLLYPARLDDEVPASCRRRLPKGRSVKS